MVGSVRGEKQLALPGTDANSVVTGRVTYSRYGAQAAAEVLGVRVELKLTRVYGRLQLGECALRTVIVSRGALQKVPIGLGKVVSGVGKVEASLGGDAPHMVAVPMGQNNFGYVDWRDAERF